MAVLMWLSSSSNDLANPKSAILARSLESSRMLLALMSLWMILVFEFSWRYARPSTVPTIISYLFSQLSTLPLSRSACSFNFFKLIRINVSKSFYWNDDVNIYRKWSGRDSCWQGIHRQADFQVQNNYNRATVLNFCALHYWLCLLHCKNLLLYVCYWRKASSQLSLFHPIELPISTW